MGIISAMKLQGGDFTTLGNPKAPTTSCTPERASQRCVQNHEHLQIKLPLKASINSQHPKESAVPNACPQVTKKHGKKCTVTCEANVAHKCIEERTAWTCRRKLLDIDVPFDALGPSVACNGTRNLQPPNL